MNRTNNRSGSDRAASRVPVGTKSVGSVAIILLVGLYAFAQPHLNDRFGWQLPGFEQLAGDDTHQATLHPDQSLPDQSLPDQSLPDQSLPDQSSSGNPDADLQYGLLREIRPQEFLSPEGLLYVPGSAEGHRLEHLRRHTQDMPSRRGKHGVFDGGMEGALVTIDHAYQRAKNKQKTTKQTDRDRTIYTVDMERRVGYVGGSEGHRQHHPVASRVKLVLEDTLVITAYPF